MPLLTAQQLDDLTISVRLIIVTSEMVMKIAFHTHVLDEILSLQENLKKVQTSRENYDKISFNSMHSNTLISAIHISRPTDFCIFLLVSLQLTTLIHGESFILQTFSSVEMVSEA